MKKITIGLFNDSFYPMADGVIMVLDNYAKRLCKFANVIVFVPSYFNKTYDDSKFPYKVVRCHSLKVPFLDYSLPIPELDIKFAKELDKYDLDIVHIHSPFTLGIAGLRYAKKHNIPCIATMHSQFEQDFERAVRSKRLAYKMTYKLMDVFNKCDECWAVNKAIANLYYIDYHYKTLPKVMNNATEMRPVKDKKKAREYINNLYGITDKQKVFLFVGRINNLKNIFFIVESLKLIKSVDYKMLFVGTGQDEEQLKSLIKKYNLNDKIIMCGKVTDREIMSYYYVRADLFLFPSIYDASSIVQIEAASQKTPTLFLKGTATASTVDDNINGYLSNYSKRSFANKIIDICNDSKYAMICKNAYRDLYHNWDDVIDEVYNNYLRIIEDYNESN